MRSKQHTRTGSRQRSRKELRKQQQSGRKLNPAEEHFLNTIAYKNPDAAIAEEQRQAQQAQKEQTVAERVQLDQLQGMKRTLAILESQKKQEQAQQPSILSMLGKASDSTLPTFQAESAQSETDRRIQELQDEIDRQENESQMQGTKRPETYTAKKCGTI